jgi:hypothetical protein
MSLSRKTFAQHNLAERHAGSINDGIRTVMVYNNAQIRYWCYAMDYFGDTFNNFPRVNEKKNVFPRIT